MSYTSKFTEIFDISPTDLSMRDHMHGPEQTELSKSTVKPITIPKKREMPLTPPHSPHNSEALSYKFKTFLNSISRKRDRSVSPATSHKPISTK